MAAPVIASVASAQTNGASSITCDKPTGTVEGDVLVAHIDLGEDRTLSTPAGWTLVRNDLNSGVRSAAYWKAAGASEGSNYTFSWTGGTAYGRLTIMRVTGADATAPINVHGGANNTKEAPSITTTVADCLLLATCVGFATAPAWTPPTGYTERWDYGTDPAGFSHTGATKEQAAAGASGTATFTSGASGVVAQHIAIAPDPSVWWNATTETWEASEVFNRSYQPQVASKTENQQTGTSTAIVIDKPAGTVEGSLLLASIAPCRDSVTFTPPAGWTLIEETTGSTGDGAPAIATYYKYATSSEPDNYSFGYTQTTAGCVGVIYRITGAAASNPVGTVEAEFSDNATGTTIPIPQVTPLLENSLLLAIGAFRDTAGTITVTPPTGMTEETEHRATFVTQEIARVVVSAGATGTKTITLSATATFRKGQLLAIAPAIPATIDQYTFPSDAWDEGDYEWTVATKDTGGQAGPYAAVRSLTVDINDPPTAPTLVSPADAATIQQGDANAFDWTHNDPESDAQSSWSLKRST